MRLIVQKYFPLFVQKYIAIYISIGYNLRKLRKASNLTQEQVVAQLQLRNLPTSRSIYSQIESGTYNIRISELIALAEIFHTDFNTIFNGLIQNK